MLPLHPKDLWPTKVVSSYPESSGRGSDFTASDDWALKLAYATACKAFGPEVEAQLLRQMQTYTGKCPLERAHVIASIRTPGGFDALYLPREQCERSQVTGDLHVDHARNAFYLHRDLHGYFDDRRLYFVPYPNAGWLAPDVPRPLDDELKDLLLETPPDGSKLVLPPAVQLEVYYRDEDAKASGEGLRPIPLPAVGNIPEVFRENVMVPAASFEYSFESHVWSQLLTDECRDWITEEIRSRITTLEEDPGRPPSRASTTDA